MSQLKDGVSFELPAWITPSAMPSSVEPLIISGEMRTLLDKDYFLEGELGMRNDKVVNFQFRISFFLFNLAHCEAFFVFFLSFVAESVV